MKPERTGEHSHDQRPPRHRLSALLRFRRRHPVAPEIAPAPVSTEVEDLSEVLAAW